MPVPIGIAPIFRASPEGHVKTTRAGDSRPPGQPPDLHEEGMVPVPIGIAQISRASPEGDKMCIFDLSVPVPIGIAPISRASPEVDNTCIFDCQPNDQVSFVLRQLTGHISSGWVLPIVIEGKEVAAIIDTKIPHSFW